MTFAQLNLHADIFKAITACGYTTPTPIQARSIPDILAGKDLVASAPTGTGKTAAFVLPALHRLSLSKSTSKPRILILTPTRELASQITQAAVQYGKFMRFNIVSLVGGMPYRQQLRDLSRPVDVIVATPGRLLDHMANSKLDLSAVEMLVLDEADRMLDMGFIDDVRDIAKATPSSRQTLLFSATVEKGLADVIRHLLKDPIRIEMLHEKLAPSLITQEVYIADNNQHKTRLLQHFLDNGNIYKAIIFSATKINADYLAKQLRDQGYEAAPLHGDLKQNVRNRTIEQLRRGKIQFLVATDVAARGIDINDITHVINYDLPKFSEDYVHRIGRTGRAGKTGTAISLVLPVDARHLQKIERYTTQKFQLSVIPGLEPTKRMQSSGPSSSSSPASSRKNRGKSNGGSRDNYAKQSNFERKPKSSDSKKSYARTDDTRNSEPRRSFARSDDTRSSNEPRRSFARSDDSRNSSEPRRSFSRSDDARKSEPRRSFARSDDTRNSSEPRRSFARSDAPRDSSNANRGEARRSYARNDDNRGGDTARGEPRRSNYARNDESRSGDTKRGDSKRSFARNDGPRGNSEPKRGSEERSYARNDTPRSSDAKRGSYARSNDAKRGGEVKKSYARTGSGKSQYPTRRDS